VSRPDVLVSYAQNCEDIVLARIFEPWVSMGHWVDIGAGHPINDSVTKLFSEFGWTGINVEPLKQEFDLLTKHRPLDVNLNCAVGRVEGTATLVEGPPESRGTSRILGPTEVLDATILSNSSTSQVEIKTLDSILLTCPWPINFIKIDVEGMETEVIASTNWSDVEVQVVVVEATLPNSIIPNQSDWEHILIEAGFVFRLFDGLNRYYSRRDFDRKYGQSTVSLWFPATVQDSFARHETFESRNAYEDLKRHLLEMSEYVQSLKDHLLVSKDELTRALNSSSTLTLEVDRLTESFARTEAERIALSDLNLDLQRTIETLRDRVEKLSLAARVS
jgi:FkbM family methyltransferase